MFANTEQEVDKLVNENFDILKANPNLFSLARNAQRRIARIRIEKYKSWKIFEIN
jgi:hypothetical protein